MFLSSLIADYLTYYFVFGYKHVYLPQRLNDKVDPQSQT